MRFSNFAFCAALVLAVNVFAEPITVTVGNGRQTASNPNGYFMGWGVNAGGISSKNYYNMAPQSKRDQWNNMFWRDTDMRHIRINAGNGTDVTTIYTADQLYSMYGTYIADVEKSIGGKITKIFDPHAGWKYFDLLGSWSPAMTDSLLRVYVAKNAAVMLDLKTKYNWDMSFVEITNEPQVYIDTTIPKNSPLYAWYNDSNRRKAVSMTKLWREELNARGLNHVKVIGPSKSGVAAAFDTLIINDFKRDSIGMSAWSGFSFHSYTSPLVKSVVTALGTIDVDIFQTESGQNPEQRGVANAISDINLGTNYWQHFQAYSWSGANDTVDKAGVRFAGIIYPATDSVTVYPYLRFYYFRELMQAIPFHAKVYNTVANSTVWPATLTAAVRSRYVNMEPVEKEQPPVNATAAELPDGRWNLIVFNPDSIPNTYNPYVPYRNTDFDVTFSVPKLKSMGTLRFTGTKVTKTKQKVNIGSFEMRDGTLTVTNVSDGDLVVLHSDAVVSDTLKFESAKASIVIADTSMMYSVVGQEAHLSIALDSATNVHVALADCIGNETGIVFDDMLSAGRHVFRIPVSMNWKGSVYVRHLVNGSLKARRVRTVCGM